MIDLSNTVAGNSRTLAAGAVAGEGAKTSCCAMERGLEEAAS
jgi:hypothetical protein